MAVSRAVDLMRRYRLIIRQVEVAHEHLDRGMAHEFLQRTDIGPIAQHPYRKRVTEPVRVDVDVELFRQSTADLIDSADG